jgi:hypothetical protein
VPDDNSTRYLCAAAQLDATFANAAIAEYLVEPVRATPPTPGVDVMAVLRECVASRARRRIRDIVLLSLLTVLAFLNLPLLIAWFGAALTAMAASVGRRVSIVRRVVGLVFGLTILSVVGSLLFVYLAQLYLTGLVGVLGSPYGYGSPYGNAYGGSGAVTAAVGTSMIIGFLLVPVIYAVLLGDASTVHWLTTMRFRRGAFQPDFRLVPSSEERLARGLGLARYEQALRRVATAESRNGETEAKVIVHRGYRPFIGGGEPVSIRTVALPLEPADKDAPPGPIQASQLHNHVAAALNELRKPSSLAPDRRLQRMTIDELVLTPAELLVTQVGSPLLPRLDLPPTLGLPYLTAQQLAEWPREWARYYRCYRVESWNRELATSCYFTAGVDRKMLYLEWTHCVLRPVEQRFRNIDRVVRFGRGPMARSLVEMLLLPTSVIHRFRTAVHTFRPTIQRTGEVVPDRYGAGANVRELAADDDMQAYFQDTDEIRYVKIIDHALVRGIGDFLEQRGYSVVEFQRAAATITNNIAGDVNNIDINNSDIKNSNIRAGNDSGSDPSQRRGT